MKQSRQYGVHTGMHIKLVFLLLLGLFLQSITVAQAADKPAESISSRFTATLEFNSEKLNSPQKIPVISFEGDIAILDQQVRVEVVNSYTQEATLALLDIEAGSAALLYPDSLNGERMPLGEEFMPGYLELFCNFARRKAPGKVKGWKMEQSDLPDGGSSYSYSGQSERNISFQIGAPQGLHRLIISSPKLTVTIDLSDVDTAATLSRADFAIPADFALRETDTKLADVLPSL